MGLFKGEQMKLKPAVPVNEEDLKKEQATFDKLNGIGNLYGWREMMTLHEQLHVLLAPFSENVYLGAAYKAEELLKSYHFIARSLIAELKEREDQLLVRAQGIDQLRDRALEVISKSAYGQDGRLKENGCMPHQSQQR